MKKAALSIQLSDDEFAKIRELDLDIDAIAEDAIRRALALNRAVWFPLIYDPPEDLEGLGAGF
jgi:post-segregation antitoxin (ccd killing protein)